MTRSYLHLLLSGWKKPNSINLSYGRLPSPQIVFVALLWPLPASPNIYLVQWNHGIIKCLGYEGILKIFSSTFPHNGLGQVPLDQVAPPNLVLNYFKDKAFITSLGNLFQCLITLSIKYSSLVFNLEQLFFNLEPSLPAPVPVRPCQKSFSPLLYLQVLGCC